MVKNTEVKMSNLLESLLSKIASVIIFLIDAFSQGYIVVYDYFNHDKTFKAVRFAILLPVIRFGKKHNSFDEEEGFAEIYLGNKFSISTNKQLKSLQVRFCLMGFGFLYTRQLDY